MKLSESRREFETRAKRRSRAASTAPCAPSARSAGRRASSTRRRAARVRDVDGNEYVDYVGSWGPMILGHAQPRCCARCARRWLARARASARRPPREVELAEAICDARCPRCRPVRLVSSGTEATMSALRLARGVTGRTASSSSTAATTATPTACWSGAGSGVATLGIPGSPGVPKAMTDSRSSRPTTTSRRWPQGLPRWGQDIAAMHRRAGGREHGLHPAGARASSRGCARSATATARC